jgi:hypothetical protein
MDIKTYIEENKQDFILWNARELVEQAGDDPVKRGKAFAELGQLVACVSEDSMRTFYVERITKEFKLKKVIKDILIDEMNRELELTGQMDDDGADSPLLPAHVDPEEFQKYGFYEENNKYMFVGKSGVMEGSNFVIKPLFHIYSKSDNKRLVEIINTYGYKKIVDVASKNCTSLDLFQSTVYAEGNYILFCNGFQFKKILSKISNEFPVCVELKTLGWQREGFYAFANGIYDGEKFAEVDELGMTEFKGVRYFAPAFSQIYKDVREDDDEYENDRAFIFLKPELDWVHWCDLMIRVYGDNGKMAIAFLIASLFRDLIYDKYKIFPHLFLFGQPQTGKSQLGWSIQNMFLNNTPPFNLNHGTNVGFFRRLARFRNATMWFDEYNNQIKPERLQSLKSAYDGVGHEKGKMTKDARTEITKVNCSCIISGQYLPTCDDNALFTRSILLEFYEKQYTEKELEDYNKLKAFEQNGLSGILLEVLQYRNEFYKKYPLTFETVFQELKGILGQRGIRLNDRLLRNFSTMLAALKIIDDKMDCRIDYKAFHSLCVEMCIKQTEQVSLGDSLATFWNMLNYLIDKADIAEKFDFKIESHNMERWPKNITDRNSRAVTYNEILDRKFVGQEVLRPTEKGLIRCLYLRLGKIHPLYLEAHRKQYGVNGVDLTSIMHYLSNHKAYVGFIKSTRFENTTSSAYVFDYDVLNIDLERTVVSGFSGAEKDPF